MNCVVGGRSDEEVGRGERGGGHERTHMVIDEREKGSHQIRQQKDVVVELDWRGFVEVHLRWRVGWKRE